MPKPPKGLLRDERPQSVKELALRAKALVDQAVEGSDILVYDVKTGRAEIKAVLISYDLYRRAVKGQRT